MTRIIGPPTATLSTVLTNLPRDTTGPIFRTHIAPAIYTEFVRLGLDPVGGIAQSYHETGAGNFGGQVGPMWYNTAGIKVRHQDATPHTVGDLPLAHAMFPSWQVGARAQAQHVRAYAGWPLPDDELVVDPRYWYVVGKYAAQRWSDMNGLWAKPGLTYGTGIEALMRRFVGMTTT